MTDQYADLIRIAKRENNQKRSYLVVNRLQGKHLPVKPAQALEMFGRLADGLQGICAAGKTLVIGFAETATAIGAAVAMKTGACYIQTTREEIAGATYLYFSEEHSHATQQRLVKEDLDRILPQTDCVIFAEDEVTTGKTIQNLIHVLQQEYARPITYVAASVINGMNPEARNVYKDQGIELRYLVKTEQTEDTMNLQKYVRKGSYRNLMQKKEGAATVKNEAEVKELYADGCLNARRLVTADAYAAACDHLWHEIDGWLHRQFSGRILVLGTEEFMYPALYVARQIEKSGAQVFFHATTRSPIEVYEEADYPFHVRYELPSLYDKNRRTFLYDIDRYDLVLIVTDACGSDTEGLDALAQAVAYNNHKIYVVRWC